MVLIASWSSLSSVMHFALRVGLPSSSFDRSHFAEAAQVSLGAADLGCQERLDEVPGHGRPDGSARAAGQ